ncbi:Exosome complex component RRP43 [Porphyridium purpureum]|uniref:Ribosomal RNA-processing protein 43 n=1 Tax=Porphyridium purpureum TaxID=35688 RepID=A0A5J4Z257_PORPP|nr:Exosome complex component RRP43 [Porphyridium purpureum]|eukprot:POR7216..scf208_2
MNERERGKMLRRVFPEQYYAAFLSRDLRSDGRALDRTVQTSLRRKWSLSRADSSGDGDGVHQSLGSVLLKAGNTMMLALVSASGVAAGVASCECVLDMGPICSPYVLRGSSHALDAAVVARQVSEMLCSTVDLEQLVIIKDVLAWSVRVDVHVINYDGNLLDATGLAALAALQRARLPELTPLHAPHNDDDTPIPHPPGIGQPLMRASAERQVRIPLRSKARIMPCSFVVIGDKLLMDPTGEEERVSDAALCVQVDETGALCKVSKYGGAVVSDEMLQECISAACGEVNGWVKLLDEDDA